MRIAVLSDRDGVGGDSQVAADLVGGYRANGHETLFLVGQRRQYSISSTLALGSLRAQLANAIPVIQRNRFLQSRLMLSGINRALNRFRPDVVHIHNLHQQLLGNGDTLAAIAANYPVVWTLHDMWAVTGGCTHSFGCRKYLSGCSDPCPQRGKSRVTAKLDIVKEWSGKRDAFRSSRNRICLACPSMWLKKLTAESVGSIVRVEHLPNGVDRSVFKPIDRGSARRVLGLPLDRPVVMFAARDLADKEKGGCLLHEALKRLAPPRPLLLAVGRGGFTDVDFDSKDMGYVADPRLMAVCYAAADFFVLPSLAENQSLVLLEALACGTPSLCFDVGGCGEIVKSCQTGFLVKHTDAAELTDALRAFIDLPQCSLAQMRNACLDASAAYDLAQQLKRYLDLIRDVARHAA